MATFLAGNKNCDIGNVRNLQFLVLNNTFFSWKLKNNWKKVHLKQFKYFILFAYAEL